MTPAALRAADGTSIPLAPHIADIGTASQRDRYATGLLTGDGLAGHLTAARSACQTMQSGTPAIGAVATVASTDALAPDAASTVVYAAALSYCPQHRTAFDNLLALPHGGLADPTSGAGEASTGPSSTSTTSTGRPTTADLDSGPSTSRRPSADTGSGCGQRAVARGTFNPSCDEYQGYLDPGRAGGREPSSGDLQTEYGCEQGYIPESQCPG